MQNDIICHLHCTQSTVNRYRMLIQIPDTMYRQIVMNFWKQFSLIIDFIYCIPKTNRIWTGSDAYDVFRTPCSFQWSFPFNFYQKNTVSLHLPTHSSQKPWTYFTAGFCRSRSTVWETLSQVKDYWKPYSDVPAQTIGSRITPMLTSRALECWWNHPETNLGPVC